MAKSSDKTRESDPKTNRIKQLEKQLETITNHLRGFDMAMVETGYRYSELYWAGYDSN